MRKCENYEHEILLNWKINGRHWPNRYHICILILYSILHIFKTIYLLLYCIYCIQMQKGDLLWLPIIFYFNETKTTQKKYIWKRIKKFNNTVLRPYSISTSAWSELFFLIFLYFLSRDIKKYFYDSRNNFYFLWKGLNPGFHCERMWNIFFFIGCESFFFLAWI